MTVIKEAVTQEFPPVGKYRIRLMQSTKDPEKHTLDIREYVSAETFEGFTRRGIRLDSRQVEILISVLNDFLTTEKTRNT